MKISEVLENVFHLKFPNRQELGLTFIRFSEHYQNPEFMFKAFTFEEIRDWYIANSPKGKKTGKFTYYEDWDGFSMPSSNLRPFYNGEFNPLSPRERKLLDLFRNRKETDFYLFATAPNVSIATYKHELAHGLFNTVPEYREGILEVLAQMSPIDRKKLFSFLREYQGGYHKNFWEEEGTCYLVDRRCLGANGVSGKGLERAGKEIKRIFNRFYVPKNRLVYS